MGEENRSLQKIENIRLQNFRTYQELNLQLGGDLIFFTGLNGAGKTSILEGAAVAANLRSFRHSSDADMIRWGGTWYTASVRYRDAAGVESLHAGYGSEDGSKPSRHLRIGSDKVTRLSGYVGKLQTVTFSPDDIEFIDSGPGERRRFVDLVLASTDPSYLDALTAFQKILRLRSAALKSEKRHDAVLDAFDADFSAVNAILRQKRAVFLREFAVPFRHYIRLISGPRENWNLVYQPSLVAEEPAAIREELRQNRPADWRLRQTTRGIHRDRLLIELEGQPGKDLSRTASQGQKRTAALALKMAHFAYARSQARRTPVLLIDDVFNELDIPRRKRFIEFLHEIGQAIITTTDVEGIREYLEYRRSEVPMQVFEVKTSDSVTQVKEL